MSCRREMDESIFGQNEKGRKWLLGAPRNGELAESKAGRQKRGMDISGFV